MNGRGPWLIGLVIILTACAATPATEPDRVATRVAEDLAVSATLTAVARQSPPTLPLIETPPSATDTPTERAATSTISSPTATRAKPIATSVPNDPIVPGFGNANGLTGQIVLPGYSGPLDEPVIRDRLVFRLEVFDPAVGKADGAGITSVDFSISDPNGKQVHQRTERTAGYCAFGGGEPTCEVWVFAQHANTWPDGTPICAGSGYQANMSVHTTNPERDNAFWGFNFSIAGDYPPCQ